MNERTISKDRYEQVFNTDMSTSDDMAQFLLDVYSQDVRDIDNLKPIIKQKLGKFNTFLNEDNIIKKLYVRKMLENENGKNYFINCVNLKVINLENVVKIDETSFLGCKSLKKYIKQSILNINSKCKF